MGNSTAPWRVARYMYPAIKSGILQYPIAPPRDHSAIYDNSAHVVDTHHLGATNCLLHAFGCRSQQPDAQVHIRGAPLNLAVESSVRKLADDRSTGPECPSGLGWNVHEEAAM